MYSKPEKVNPFGPDASKLAPNQAIVPYKEVSESRICLHKGGEDKDGWYSKNGVLRLRSKPMTKADEIAWWGNVPKTQEEFLEHVREGRLDRVEDMLEFQKDEIDINYQEPKKGQTALMVATLKHNVDIVSVLLEARADPHIRDKTDMRFTPLEVAQVIMEDEDADFEEVVEILRVACGYETLPPTRRVPYAGRGRLDGL